MKDVIIGIVAEFRHIKRIKKQLTELDLLKYVPVSSDNFGQCLFDYLYPEKIKKCKLGKTLRFIGFSVGYRFCGPARSCECAMESVAVQVSNAAMEHDSIKKTEILEHRKKTVKEKFGVDNVFQDENVKQKSKQTCIERFGFSNPMQSAEIKERAAQTCTERHGARNPGQVVEFREKMKETCLERYGVEYGMQSDAAKEKYKLTMLEKYGVEHPMLLTSVKDRVCATNMTRYGVGNVSTRHYSLDTIAKLADEDWLVSAYMERPVASIAAELGISVQPIYTRLREYDVEKYGSAFEMNIISFIKTITDSCVVQNTRKIIAPHEIDIYLPGNKIAIECNGSYWHSELQGRGREYHVHKTNACKEQGIQLIHIWGHDWIQKCELIKSRIKAKLGKNARIYARKCAVQLVDSCVMTDFLNKNHIQGNCPASVRYGLFYQDELVAVMTFGKSRYKKDIEFELLRYCSKQGINVTGGASKLFKKFTREYDPESVISYSDRMWNTGTLYEQLGFEYSHSSPPSYSYTMNYLDFENRVAYQKHKLKDKLENYNPDLTEWKNMKIHGFDRLWDSGNDVWVYKRGSK